MGRATPRAAELVRVSVPALQPLSAGVVSRLGPTFASDRHAPAYVPPCTSARPTSVCIVAPGGNKTSLLLLGGRPVSLILHCGANRSEFQYAVCGAWLQTLGPGTNTDLLACAGWVWHLPRERPARYGGMCSTCPACHRERRSLPADVVGTLRGTGRWDPISSDQDLARRGNPSKRRRTLGWRSAP